MLRTWQSLAQEDAVKLLRGHLLRNSGIPSEPCDHKLKAAEQRSPYWKTYTDVKEWCDFAVDPSNAPSFVCHYTTYRQMSQAFA